jgi:SAM-dependent methyltransferase
MSIHERFYTEKFRAVTGFYKGGDAEGQVDFIERCVPLKAGERILDLACGFGRHAIPLARKGYCVTGYDQSEDYIEMARKEAERAGVQVSFEQLDMRHLDDAKEFDAVLSMSTSLAFYSDEVNWDIFRRVHRALKAGGRFLFDQANVFWLVQVFGGEGKSETQKLPDGRVHTVSTRFDPELCVMSRRSVLDGEEAGWDIRYYTLPELKSLVGDLGFRCLSVYGDYDASPHRSGSARIIVVLEKE